MGLTETGSMRRPLLPLFSVLILGAGACGPPSEETPGGTPGDPWVIGMSQCNLGEPWRVQMDADVRAAAEAHPNLRVIFKDAQNNSLTQRAQVEELVEQGVDLIIISPKEAMTLPTGSPLAFRITSSGCNPALSAAEPSATSATSAPRPCCRPKAPARSPVRSCA